ncbi:MAG TPA: hypothetical protein VF364_08495 [Candidatus Limnocylindria bacterium]
MAEPWVELVTPAGAVLEHAGFRVELQSAPLDGIAGVEISLTLTRTASDPVACGVRIGLDLPVGERPPGWLVPGLFYGENRPPACRRIFPRYERGAHDPWGMVSERWSFRADRAATPAVFGWSGSRMAAIAVDEVTELGPAGIGFEGSAERTRVWVDLPFREEPVAYRGYDEPGAADVRTHAWQPGETRTVTLTVAEGGDDRHGYVPLLRHLHARASSDGGAPWVGIEEAAELAADGLLAWHYHPEHRALYETAAFERELDGSAAGGGDRPHMHVGWVSGAPWAAQLLAWGRRTGSEPHRQAGEEVLDHIAENLSPSGTFWAEWTLESGWGSGWSPRGAVHANTIGQATLFFLRALAAEDAHGARHVTWEAAVRSNLDAIARRQRADGNLGTYHDAESGRVTEWDGAGALTWIAALLEGAVRHDEPLYRTAAVAAGGFYRRFVDAELVYGAPEDVHLAPSSEDGYNALIAFMALHRATGDAEWLDVARRAADWLLTFRYAYDVAFEPDTILGQYRFRTRGTDQASPANQHLHHFGLLCYPELLELADATGDDHYRQRAVESLAAWRQFVARRDGDFNAMRGMVSERFYQTDCFRAKGSLLPLSHAWTGGVLLFACLAALEDLDAVPA